MPCSKAGRLRVPKNTCRAGRQNSDQGTRAHVEYRTPPYANAVSWNSGRETFPKPVRRKRPVNVRAGASEATLRRELISLEGGVFFSSN